MQSKSTFLSALKALALITALVVTPDCCLQAQSFQTPIAGNIYGQNIVDCNGVGGYEYVATGTTIYARRPAISDYYTGVWKAPGALHIKSFANRTVSGHQYRAILLQDGDGNFYVTYNNIKALAPDSTINGLVQLPTAYSGKYVKIIAGGGLYAYSVQAGGPPGNLTVSWDNGVTWQPDTLGIGYDVVLDAAPDNEGNLYMAGSGGIYKQTSGDSAWSLVNSNSHNATKIYVDAMNRILISRYGVNTYLSTDSGTTFTADAGGLSGQVSKLAGDAYGNLYAVCGGLFRNLGGNSAWLDISNGFDVATNNQGQITCIYGDSLLIIGTNNYGILSSNNNGNTCTVTNNGILAEDIYSLITQPDGRLLCTTDLGIFYKDAADTLWHPTNTINTFYPGTLLSNDKNGNIFVAVGPTFGSPYPLGKSTDNGLNFVVDSAGFSTIGGAGFYIDEAGDRHFYNYYATFTNPLAIWTSRLGSSIWNVDSVGLPLFSSSGLGVKDMCDDQRGYLYASFGVPAGGILYRRPVTGTTWVADTAGLGVSNIISPMAANASLGLIVARGAELYRRGANGWINIPQVPSMGGISSGGINALSIDDNGVIYLSFANYSSPDSNAVFFSKDTGATWQLAGLVGKAINNIVSVGDTTYALTFGNWGYVTTSNVTDVQNTSEVQTQIHVFPNPAKESWNIQTPVAWIGNKYTIADVNGRIVITGQISSANITVASTTLAKGIYLLQIYVAAGNISTVLVKQ